MNPELLETLVDLSKACGPIFTSAPEDEEYGKLNERARAEFRRTHPREPTDEWVLIYFDKGRVSYVAVIMYYVLAVYRVKQVGSKYTLTPTRSKRVWSEFNWFMDDMHADVEENLRDGD